MSVVARRHDINANLLFKWRNDPRYASQVQSILPIEFNASVDARGRDDNPNLPSEIGIWVEGDVRLVVKGGFDPNVVGTLIRSIKANS